MILCGGKGTRLRDATESLPKPMVPIGDVPIVVHIMRWYAKFGIKKFVLCLGYKKEVFIDYFSNFLKYTNDISIDLKSNTIDVITSNSIDWQIILCDTGIDSKTGLRIKTAFDKHINGTQFFLTYGDGVSDVDVQALYISHMASRKPLTMTQVKSPTRFGLIEIDNNGIVLDFKEKNQSDGYINGGFMVVEKDFIDRYVDESNVFFEKEPMEKAIQAKDVHAYTHNGFWQCMDNIKEYNFLNLLWKSGKAPWKVLV